MNPLDVSPDNIDSYRQNLPVLVAQDLREHFDVPLEATAKILLARGVMKWLACRRDIIALKDQWRAKLRELQAIAAQSHEEYHYRRGYMAALKECREAVRAVCHSSRWRAPDTDRWSSWYISELAKEDRVARLSARADHADGRVEGGDRNAEGLCVAIP